jgi:hypothetical protein
MVEVVYVKQSNGTSILTVNLNDISAKCMKLVCKNPEEWIENLVSSRCQPEIENVWREHVKESIKQNTTPKTKNELIVGYEPSSEVIFESRIRSNENDDGSLEIEVEIDAVFTACIQNVFLNPVEEIKRLVCSRIDKQIDEIIDKTITKGTYTGKTRDEIILTYEPEPEVELDLSAPDT